MATCPNINLDSWKSLVASRGEDMSYYLWDKYEGNVPESEYTPQIKPGVTELFDSNPELANAVYEAAGLKNLNSNFRVEYEKDGKNIHYILYNQSGRVGTFSFIEKTIDGKKYLKALSISTKEQGKGFGTEFYRQVLNNLPIGIEGVISINDLVANKKINNIQNTLQNEGYTITIKDDFKILSTKKITQQQAQQLYSQYLDTIFPDSKVKDIVYHSSNKKVETLTEGFSKEQRSVGFHFYNLPNTIYGEIINPAIINAKNRYIPEGLDEIREIEYLNKEDKKYLKSKGFDYSLIYKNEYVVFEPEQIHILGGKQDIEGFKEFVNTEAVVEPLYSPIGEESNLQYQFKAVANIYKNLDKINKLWKQIGNNNTFWNKIQQDFQIPKDQINLLKESEGNSIEEKLASFAANYSYTVEINVATESTKGSEGYYAYEMGNDISIEEINGKFQIRKKSGKLLNEKFDTKEQALNSWVELTDEDSKPTQHYSNLTVPGGTNYTENEIATAAVTPSIKGHAQFATENGIGWFRSDDKQPFTGFLEDLIASGTIKKVPCG